MVGSEGILTAGENAGDPVTFTSSRSAQPNAGDWEGIRFEGGSSGSLRNCIVQYANYGVFINGDGDHSLTNSTFRYNNKGIVLRNYGTRPDPATTFCGIYGNVSNSVEIQSHGSWGTSTLDFRSNWWGTDDPEAISQGIHDYFENSSSAVVDFSSFLDSENGEPITSSPDGSYLIGGTYDDLTLSGNYLVPSYFKVQPGHEVVVRPGATIKFMPDAFLMVGSEGILTAGENAGDPVTFTSSQSTKQSAGDWEGIRLELKSFATFSNCIVQYANYGVYITGDGDHLMTNTTFRYNKKGIVIKNYGTRPDPTIQYSKLYENVEYNCFVEYHGGWNTTILDAQNNYWGTIDPKQINNTIFDYTESSDRAIVDFSSFLDATMNIADFDSMLGLPEGVGDMDLADVIAILQVLSGRAVNNPPQVDIDGDNHFGLPEAIIGLQFLANLRASSSVEAAVQSGTIFADMTLTRDGSPYILDHNVRVLPGVTLTIEPGVEIQFTGNNTFWVDGELEALGTEAEPITFTSGRATPSPGNWHGIYFHEDAIGTISHCQIEYAYRGVSCFRSSPNILDSTIQNCSNAGIYLDESSSVIENNTFQNNSSYAVSLYQSSPRITGNFLSENQGGIFIADSSFPTINGNSIFNNSNGADYFDVRVSNYNDAANVVINASNNWWGSTVLRTIEDNIFEYNDSQSSGRLLFNPVLNAENGEPINAIMIIRNIATSRSFFTPITGTTSEISYELTEDTNVTVSLHKAYQEIGGRGGGTYKREFFMNLLKNQTQTAGAHTVSWDGRDARGNMAEASAYVYAIKADSGDGRIDLYDPVYISGSVSITDSSLNPATYNPYANETVELRYSLFQPAWITIGGYGMPEFILEAAPQEAGAQVVKWNGRDGLGDIVDWDVTLAATTQILPENVLVLKFDTSLAITDISTDAYVIIPAYGEISTVKYRLSRDAAVTITIRDPNGNNWTLMEASNQVLGMHNIEWDGTNSEGKMVWPWSDGPEGDYSVQITATDADTGTKRDRGSQYPCVSVRADFGGRNGSPAF